MEDGLYRVQFQTPIGMGAGVVVLQGGTLRGGDSGMYYVGTYHVDGENLTATVNTNRHTANLQSVFGQDQVEIHLQGKIQNDTATVTGNSAQAPGIAFTAILTKLNA